MPSGQQPQLIVEAPADRLRRLKELQYQWEALEKERLGNLDVFSLIGYTPSPKQAEFHAATEYDVLYGGAAGGGKSAALVAEGLRACAKFPGLRCLLVRRTYDELEESIFPALRKFHMGEPVGGRWNGTSRELSFSNGSLFRFRYMETLAHASRRQGGEYQLLLVDELTLMIPGVVDILKFERMRASAGQPIIGVRASSNPGGPGHGQVKARYIDATRHGQRVVTDEHGLTIRFIHAKATDNPHLDAGYAARLDAIPDPARRAAMRDGDWDQFAGMMFKEFRRDLHTVDPVTVPLSWRRYNGIDWGFAAPWAVLWGATDEDGRVWIYRERYQTHVGEADQARSILAAEEDGEHVGVRYADDAMWATRGDAKPISEVYSEEGVALTQAGSSSGSRIAGWQRIHSYMKEGPACQLHKAQGRETCPMIHIFRTCENLLSELTNIPYATTGNPEDSDSNAPDHACLVAGTLVSTARGPVPIEQVAAGDRVWTRAGLRRVTAAGMTARGAQVGTVILSDGRVLTGTANHPVWVAGQGWTRLDALRYAAILEAWPQAYQCSSMASPSVATRTRHGGLTGCTTALASLTVSAAPDASIRSYGRPSTAPSRQAMTSITSTATRSITTPATSSACLTASTTRTITPSGTTGRRSGWRTSMPSGRPLLNGTGRRQAAPGTASTAKTPGRTASPSRPCVSSAAAPTRRTGRKWPGSARTAASQSGGAAPASMMRLGRARPAAASTPPAGTPGSARARVAVARSFAASEKPADVYNLTVDGDHEFYANGVLVHNCDALRYLLINLGTGPQFVILDAAPAQLLADAGVEILEPAGAFAVRPDPADILFGRDMADEGRPRAGTTQIAPWAVTNGSNGKQA